MNEGGSSLKKKEKKKSKGKNSWFREGGEWGRRCGDGR